mgnify:CR=1 FL=1
MKAQKIEYLHISTLLAFILIPLGGLTGGGIYVISSIASYGLINLFVIKNVQSIAMVNLLIVVLTFLGIFIFKRSVVRRG